MLGNSPKIWHIVFCDPAPYDPSEPEQWHDWALRQGLRFLSPGFRHVHAFTASPSGGWLVVNPHATKMDVVHSGQDPEQDGYLQELGFSDYGIYANHMERCGVAHIISVPEGRPTSWQFRPWVSCVEIIKHTVGLETPWWVWTPAQLYAWLSKPDANDVGCRR